MTTAATKVVEHFSQHRSRMSLTPAGHESEQCSEWSDCSEEPRIAHKPMRPKPTKGIEKEVLHLGIDEGSTTAISGDEINPLLLVSTSESELEDRPTQIWSLLRYSRKTLLLVRDRVVGSPPVKYTSKGIQELSRTFPKPLHASARPSDAAKPISRHSEDDRLARAVRAALTDFAPGNSDAVCQQLASRGAKTASQFCIVLAEVFDKGYNSHSLISSCVDLCLKLRDDPRFEPSIGAEGGPHSFRQCVLDQVWPSFQRHLEAKNCTTTSQKRCALGVTKMISELIVRGVVSPRLLVECADSLWRQSSENPFTLELLAVLIVVGPRLNLQSWTHLSRFEVIIRQVKELTSSGGLPPQTRGTLKESVATYYRDSGAAPRGTAPSTSMLQLAKSALLSSDEPATSVPLKKQLRPEAPATAVITASSKSSPSIQEILARSANSKKRVPESSKVVFNPVVFHRELSVTLRQLSLDGDVDKAVAKIVAQHVPLDKQEKEFADLLTRACEMSRDIPRQAAFALAASIASSDPGVFDHAAAWSGTKLFFETVYSELCSEVPKLPLIVRTELLPALRTVFTQSLLDDFTTTVG